MSFLSFHLDTQAAQTQGTDGRKEGVLLPLVAGIVISCAQIWTISMYNLFSTKALEPKLERLLLCDRKEGRKKVVSFFSTRRRRQGWLSEAWRKNRTDEGRKRRANIDILTRQPRAASAAASRPYILLSSFAANLQTLHFNLNLKVKRKRKRKRRKQGQRTNFKIGRIDI
jgi:hypothetical protein